MMIVFNYERIEMVYKLTKMLPVFAICLTSGIASAQADFDDSVGRPPAFMAPDLCSNIVGYQNPIPGGMSIDPSNPGVCVAPPTAQTVPDTSSVFNGVQFPVSANFEYFGGGRFFVNVVAGYEVTLTNATGEAIDVVSVSNCLAVPAGNTFATMGEMATVSPPPYSTYAGITQGETDGMGYLFTGSYMAGLKYEIGNSALFANYRRCGRGGCTQVKSRMGCAHTPVSMRIYPGQDLSSSVFYPGYLVFGGEFVNGRNPAYNGTEVSQRDQAVTMMLGSFVKRSVVIPRSSLFSGAQTIEYRLSNGQTVVFDNGNVSVR